MTIFQDQLHIGFCGDYGLSRRRDHVRNHSPFRRHIDAHLRHLARFLGAICEPPCSPKASNRDRHSPLGRFFVRPRFRSWRDRRLGRSGGIIQHDLDKPPQSLKRLFFLRHTICSLCNWICLFPEIFEERYHDLLSV